MNDAHSSQDGSSRSDRAGALERVMEVGLRERYGSESPPDLRARILLRAGRPERPRLTAVGADGEPVVRRRAWLERGVVAAGVAGLITAAFFLVNPFGENGGGRDALPVADGGGGDASSGMVDSVSAGGGAAETREIRWLSPGVAAPSDGEWRKGPDGLRLDRGWLILDEASEPVHRFGRTALVKDGRALVFAGDIPRGEAMESLFRELSTHRAKSARLLTEGDLMKIRNPGYWTARGGLALCLLGGTAVLDGGTWQAQEAGDGTDTPVAAMLSKIESKSFDMLDANKDGVVDGTELSPEAIKVVDKDGDGKVSKEEFPEAGIYVVTREDAEGVATVVRAFVKTGEGVSFVGTGAKDGGPIAAKWVTTGGNRVFRALDTNKDGNLDGGEAGAVLLKHADTDGDSLVSMKEWNAATSHADSTAEPGKTNVRVTFAKLDGDGDGKITAADLPQPAITELDKDASGDVSAEEFDAAGIMIFGNFAVAGGGMAPASVTVTLTGMFDMLDKDKDGFVSGTELESFKTDKVVDTDGDGKISRAEWDTAFPKVTATEEVGEGATVISEVQVEVVSTGEADVAAIEKAIAELSAALATLPAEDKAEVEAKIAALRAKVVALAKQAEEKRAKAGAVAPSSDEAKPAAPGTGASAAGTGAAASAIPAPPAGPSTGTGTSAGK